MEKERENSKSASNNVDDFQKEFDAQKENFHKTLQGFKVGKNNLQMKGCTMMEAPTPVGRIIDDHVMGGWLCGL